MDRQDTIVALSTAKGRAAISIIRVSGPDAVDAVKQLCGSLDVPRTMALRRLSYNSTLIDEALVVHFEAGKSYTGEDLVEIHGHGGSAVIKLLISTLIEHCGCRSAEPGEFTRRAVMHGSLDLAQAEAVIDIIEAECEAQHQIALEILDGAVSRKVKSWREQVIQLLGLCEASIDFADEEDAPVDVSLAVSEGTKELIRIISDELKASDRAVKIRDGFSVALVGAPNVGKSSLINYLSQQDLSIVTDIPGTTRDIIEARLNINGHLVSIYDLAGIRDSTDPVEKIGIEKSIKRAKHADLRIFLSTTPKIPENNSIKIEKHDLVVQTKSDLSNAPHENGISVVTGHGIDRLLCMISDRLMINQKSPSGLFAHARQRIKLKEAVSHLSDSLNVVEVEIRAFQLYSAAESLENIVGAVNPDDVLDDVFSNFCIGK